MLIRNVGSMGWAYAAHILIWLLPLIGWDECVEQVGLRFKCAHFGLLYKFTLKAKQKQTDQSFIKIN